ncbi:hypothetical protein [Undibacterium oligocarboniphilum]|uniref:Uncharacterized protein n=1 Tax=Undibacterium oligocarboniphilum TaxID=666702 RepID=A0A850QRF7_9BURK|nr:hypothetical protein [Undibacterium oligocarboniphilum]MBC3871754.1 hypothetical protein [Undibacterium oligocarboniphilum]NVO79390.1 hypothetical protein [Undibacterium oligocarboniphilum]
MQTPALLERMNFQRDQITGVYVDRRHPMEFMLNIHKDCGAERWILFANKLHFALVLGDEYKHSIFTACAVSEALPFIQSMLQQLDLVEAQQALQLFEDHCSALPLSEEDLTNSVCSFLNGESTKTLPDMQRKEILNQFRNKSGHKPLSEASIEF